MRDSTPKVHPVIRPRLLTISKSFYRVFKKAFDDFVQENPFFQVEYAVAFYRIAVEKDQSRMAEVLVDRIKGKLNRAEYNRITQYLKTPRNLESSPDMTHPSVPKLDEGLEYISFSPTATSLTRHSFFRSGLNTKEPSYAHINLCVRSNLKMGNYPLKILEVELNEEYSKLLQVDFVSILSSFELEDGNHDPVDGLQSFLLEVKDTIPDLDIVVWEYEEELDALEAKASSVDGFIFDVFDTGNPIWNCYRNVEVSDVTNISSSFARKDTNSHDEVSAFRKAISYRKWKSGYFSPLVVRGACRGTVGFMAGYYGGLGEHYKSFINLVRIHIARCLVERDNLLKDVEMHQKRKALMPIVAVGREVNQRMHDIRDRLNAVKNYLVAVKNEKSYPDRHMVNEKAEKGLGVLRSINKTLSKQLQTFKKARETVRKTEIRAYLDNVVETATVEYMLDTVQLRTDFPESPCHAKLQKFYFERALENILSNAAYFCRINHATEECFVDFKVTADDKLIRFIVTDYGQGIQQRPIEKIFEDGETTKNEGFGIGLSITQSIVEEHGGVITAENIDKAGARFTISVPRVY